MGKAQKNEQWWHEKVVQLQKQAEPFAEIEPATIYTKGFWAAIKLTFMKYALGFYAPIMAKNRADGLWDSLHFIDFCAGSGLTRLESGRYPGNTLTVTGSALIGAHESRFDHYHFAEPNKASANALRSRLAARVPAEKFTVYDEASGSAIPKIVAAIKAASKRPHFMGFVDPEGLTEVTLPSLVPLFEFGRGDFLFNYQYMGVRRIPEPAASAFFGSNDWPRTGPEVELQEYFLSRLKAFGRPASLRLNIAAGKGSGRYAYDLVYCAAETKAKNPWLTNLQVEIEKRMAGLDGALLEDFILGGQRTLF
ncbi:MAG TPA: three-Cys-motif partner protein TcmP [Thermoplasmata archaeon]|nr:three-Cys-motif partner protein TcmP [Thermoplasmata archaeon]